MEEHASTVHLLPETGYLRLAQIIGRAAIKSRPAIPAIIPVSRSTWWAGVKSGRYPQPTRVLGQRITAWRVEDVRSLVECGAGEKPCQSGERRKTASVSSCP